MSRQVGNAELPSLKCAPKHSQGGGCCSRASPLSGAASSASVGRRPGRARARCCSHAHSRSVAQLSGDDELALAALLHGGHAVAAQDALVPALHGQARKRARAQCTLGTTGMGGTWPPWAPCSPPCTWGTWEGRPRAQACRHAGTHGPPAVEGRASQPARGEAGCSKTSAPLQCLACPAPPTLCSP